MSSSQATFDISSLQRAIDRLAPLTKKTLPEIVNQRLLNIAGRALNATRKASKLEIQARLGEIGRELKRSKAGKIRRGKRLYASIDVRGQSVPLAALLINSARGAKGEKGLTGKEMAAAIKKKVAARQRSVGFNAIGYVPGIRSLARSVTKPFLIGNFRGLAVRGQAKGEATPATESFVPVAELINKVDSILKVDKGALQQAINEEAREIERHIAEDISPLVKAFNQSV